MKRNGKIKDDKGKLKMPSKDYFNKFFQEMCGCSMDDISSFGNFTKLLYRPSDPSGLGVVRALFGLCMVIDVVEERGFADVDLKWGDFYTCHFPLIHDMEPLSLPWMVLLYTIMWTGAFGMMLGFHFKFACACFSIPYWYIFVLDKSFWNNHSYLYGIVAVLLWGTDANKYFAVDANSKRGETVPFWNYFILRFQFFVMYFLAGLKKSSKEWLEGYSMTNLSNHWVFYLFTIFWTKEQTDFYIVHWFGFIFDLTVGFWMLYPKTRVPAMAFCIAFHFMNSRLFSIGMFPYACLATMPLFCPVDWPRKVEAWFSRFNRKKTNRDKNDNETKTDAENKGQKVSKKQKTFVSVLLCHMLLQLFLPYSHFVTKGYNNWVPGLYGYSWDMMIHSWDTILVVIRVHDNENNEDHYIDAEAWTLNDRWQKHGDMLKQYAHCIKRNLALQKRKALATRNSHGNAELIKLSSSISIYADVWCSLNGRFQQRMFNSSVDLLTAEWHLFRPVSYVMPLLTQFSSYRYRLDKIQRQVNAWSEYADVLFVADYPGMHLENYIDKDMTNVSLTVLEGSVIISAGKREEIVEKGRSVKVMTEKLHAVKVASSEPSCYMYTFSNGTKLRKKSDERESKHSETDKESPLLKELKYKFKAWSRTFSHITNAFFYFVYNVPMIRRTHSQK